MIAAAMILATTTLIQAQPVNESKPAISDEIVVKGKKEGLNESLEVREIRESNAKDTGEALEKIEGLSKIRKGGIANDIDIRGLKRDNINVLIDGQRLYGACPNRMDPTSFHVDFAEVNTIEVIKGPYNVKNPGGMGGEIDIKTKDIKPGLHHEINLKGGSFDTKEGSLRSSYANDWFGFLVAVASKTASPYFDGKGRRLTEQYSDFDSNRSLLFAPYAAPEITAAMSQLSMLQSKAPAQFAQTFANFDVSAPPATNRYKYDTRSNNAYEMRTGWIKTFVKPTESQKLEVSFTKQETENVMYPYLSMDAIYDNSSRGSLTYTIENITSRLKEVKLSAYGNSVDHLMTDNFRCSSTANAKDCYLPLAQGYSMTSLAKTDTKGGKIEATIENPLKEGQQLFAKTTVGADVYRRNWNVTNSMRMKHFKDTSMMMGMGMGMMMGAANYREQSTIPDVTTDNVGGYIENESRLSSKLRLNTGIRHDKAISKANQDRRVLYNAHYPNPNDIYQFQYQKFAIDSPFMAGNPLAQVIQGTTIDAEIYLPATKPTIVDETTTGNARLTVEVNDSLEVFVGFGHGARLPDPQERFFALQRMGTVMAPDAVGNPDLKPTTNDQGDLGFKYFNGTVLWKTQVFYNKLYNYIVTRYAHDTYLGKLNTYNDTLLYMQGQEAVLDALDSASGVKRIGRSYKNVDATIYGAESSVRVTLPGDFYTGAGGSYNRGINDTERLELQEMSPLRGRLWVRYDNGKYFGELEGVFASTQTLVDRAIGEMKTPGWGIANFKAGIEFEGLKFVAGVENIFNRFYYQHLSYSREPFATGLKVPEPGRNWFASMQWQF